ncbi:MAG: dTMP kinase [Christensenellaceae bacterium]|jgi:dTMP kinase|nr:dTMP kinase [Christensenellaceae bacterium]
MRYAGLIFDLDGTLLDTSEGVLGCVEETIDALKLRAVEPNWRKEILGPPLSVALSKFFGLDEAGGERALAEFRRRYAEWGVQKCRPYDGIIELLRDFKRRGLYLAVATSKAEPFAQRALESSGLLPFFDRVCGPGLQVRGHGKRDLIRRAIEGEDGPFLMVGDRRFDVEGAKACGMDCAYALYGFGSAKEAIESGAEFMVETADAIWALVEGPGHFFSFEGGDGAGKTTQIALVKAYLEERGYRVRQTREPGGDAVAERIRELLLEPSLKMDALTEAYLYAAARAEHVRAVLRPALLRGEIVLSDRYVDSSIAYQGYGRGLGEKLVRAVNEAAIGGLMPERSYFLELNAVEAERRAKSRTGKDRIEMEGEAFKVRVEQGFLEIAAKEPERVRRIDAGSGVDEVFARIRADLEGWLDSSGTSRAGTAGPATGL